MFLLPWVAFAAVTSIIGLMGGGGGAAVGFAVDQYQRQKGYKPGEGVFTPRYNGFHGIFVGEDSDCALGSTLATFAGIFPDVLQKYADKRYTMTISEGRQLKSMTDIPAKLHHEFLESGIIDLLKDNPLDKELTSIVELHTKTLFELVQPIAVFFSQFPQERVSEQ